jgi:mono/diheme cytochrome c family protein
MIADHITIRIGKFALRFLGALALVVLFAGSGKQPRAKGNVAHGKELFDSTCDACHYANSHVARAGPGLADFYKKKKLMNGAPLTDANLDRWIRDGSRLMPGYKNMLSDEQMRDLIAYLKTL